jgi:hypothetical protein
MPGWVRSALPTVMWTIFPTAGVFLFNLAFGRPPTGPWTLLQAVRPVPGWLGLFLPFAAFASGLATWRGRSRWEPVVHGLMAAAMTYGLLAYAAPVAKQTSLVKNSAEPRTQFDFHPATPGSLKEWRASIEADPPAQFTFMLERPLERPPNWLTFLLHNPAVMALFAILAVFLGQQVGFLTSGLSPPWRQNSRWAVGLLAAIGFWVSFMAGEAWVRADPAHSGVLGAWVPLLVPLVEVGLLYALVHRRRGRSHVSAHQPSE